MKVKKLLCLLAILMPMLFTSCYVQQSPQQLTPEQMAEVKRQYIASVKQKLQNDLCQEFEIVREPQFQFQNLKGLNINIEPTEAEYSQSEDFISLSNSTCFIMPTVNYIKAMRFNDTEENEYTLNIYLKKINANMWCSNEYGSCCVSDMDVTFQIIMTNIYGEVIFEQVVSSSVDSPILNTWNNYFERLNNAYTQALEQINWHKIASFLKKSSAPKQLAKEEPRKQVEGYGNTALESTIVRWDVQSRPAGADVFWRVVSKTPSVKSTNNKYLQTTPYEATKSLDIRGLSYENSGDVRVILRCEKDGYYPQEKEFNVRMIIDQEEISAFFKLVKVE